MSSMSMREWHCGICGKLVVNENCDRYHRGCVIDDVYDTIMRGEKVTMAQRLRLRHRDIDIAELRKTVIEDMVEEERRRHNDEEAKGGSRRTEKAGGLKQDACMV